MIEILPNWHPFFVHFSVSLLIISFVLFVTSSFSERYAVRMQMRMFARWSLWIGALMTVFTVAAGIYAYYTVAHDGPSHEWMTIHRNVALATFVVFAVLAIWSIVNVKGQKDEGKGFISILTLAFIGLLATSWLGGELVYRHGLGVMSLPEVSGEGHDHAHGDGDHHGSGSIDSGHHDLMGDSAVKETPHSHDHSDNKPHSH